LVIGSKNPVVNIMSKILIKYASYMLVKLMKPRQNFFNYMKLLTLAPRRNVTAFYVTTIICHDDAQGAKKMEYLTLLVTTRSFQ
jgi:hypothetical protein